MRVTAMLALLPLFAARESSPSATEPSASVSLPAQVLPHCLYGLDPHAAAVQPWPTGPEPRGYRLEPSSPTHLLSWLGFRKDDVLTAVNDQPLGTAEHHYAARQATQAATTCRWSIQREGQPAVLEATIAPDPSQELVLERDPQGVATRLSRVALLQRLSDPYAYGPYPSMLAMGADPGVYMVDKGMVSLAADLGFQPLDHHIAIGEVQLSGGKSVLEGLRLLLTEPEQSWTFRRGGELRTVTLRIEGDPVVLPERR